MLQMLCSINVYVLAIYRFFILIEMGSDFV
ncbi:putative membrane protein [Yersinia pestis 1045]|uniref:Uncharacterized protein n=2 Tax=Yersinia pseudotuberculosis complex TaxID=1649845 RepID=A0AAX2I1M3_YERPE|nr:putative membrane protein [Yersinia pseudotuberculosis]AJI92406.1 putative membrane protein [Yersinia pestis]AJJ00012.1 putative membrane protein [Yersinia pestis Pestoides F]AJJ55754.1 putative membrane protein [Yersinia pseudotuberculosis IP 32953]AJJ67905.1 putative membrane protein [Yersinia pseudotuberculosis PB1/+]AJJ75603.1 putative membrane protein [Yersinia pestis A1122]AJJ77738.1 putative membrane protein [Yersinia pestis Antiqua]AJJ83885.1 putative membrane protein [Yersinia pe